MPSLRPLPQGVQDGKRLRRACAYPLANLSQIPQKFVPIFNKIIHDWDRCADDDEDGKTAIRQRLASANKEMRLHQCNLDRRSGKSKLTSRGGAVASSSRPELLRIAGALENLVDSYRAVVSCIRFPFAAPALTLVFRMASILWTRWRRRERRKKRRRKRRRRRRMMMSEG